MPPFPHRSSSSMEVIDNVQREQQHLSGNTAGRPAILAAPAHSAASWVDRSRARARARWLALAGRPTLRLRPLPRALAIVPTAHHASPSISLCSQTPVVVSEGGSAAGRCSSLRRTAAGGAAVVPPPATRCGCCFGCWCVRSWANHCVRPWGRRRPGNADGWLLGSRPGCAVRDDGW